jgi:hypothetical protein
VRFAARNLPSSNQLLPGASFPSTGHLQTIRRQLALEDRGFAQFLLGLANSGNITNLHNVDYGRPVYAFYIQDDYKVTPNLTLNLGLRSELFFPVRERFDAQGSFDLASKTMLVPKGQTAQFTPFIAASIPISATLHAAWCRPTRITLLRASDLPIKQPTA